jgi:hypothetical protein
MSRTLKNTLHFTHIADTPGNSTFLVTGSRLIGLTFNAEIHNVISANGTVVNNNVCQKQNTLATHQKSRRKGGTNPMTIMQRRSTEAQ